MNLYEGGLFLKKSSKFMNIVYIILILSLAMIIYCFVQNNWIEVENIKIEVTNLPKELKGLKIAHVSDVHLPKNASNIDGIVNKVKHQSPDIIVLTGDVIDESANITKCGLSELCKGLSEITQVYAVTGNHEFWHGDVEEWTRILTENNIKVIDNKIEIYTKNNKSIAIIGLQDGVEYNPENYKNIDKIKNMPMILLAHRPELFVSSYSSNVKRVKPNIIFAGHAHGGQFRIPIINKGVVAPNQGFFPEYTSGVYINNDITLVVSRGLGNSIIPIRINNRPHLPIIELD